MKSLIRYLASGGQINGNGSPGTCRVAQEMKRQLVTYDNGPMWDIAVEMRWWEYWRRRWAKMYKEERKAGR